MYFVSDSQVKSESLAVITAWGVLRWVVTMSQHLTQESMLSTSLPEDAGEFITGTGQPSRLTLYTKEQTKSMKPHWSLGRSSALFLSIIG